MSEVYCGCDKIPKGKRRGTASECYMNKQVRYYGIEEVPEGLISEGKKTLQKVNVLKKEEKGTMKKIAAKQGAIDKVVRKYRFEKSDKNKKELYKEGLELIKQKKELAKKHEKLTKEQNKLLKK